MPKKASPVAPALVFEKIDREHFESLCPYDDDYEESEIDGHRVICAYDGNNCVSIYYVRAKVISYCPKFIGDAGAYSEKDTFWPYGD